MLEYSGFVYEWIDKKYMLSDNHPWLYIGSHKGNINDGYIGSGKIFKRSFRRRSCDFERRILEFVYGDQYKIFEREQFYLDMIDEGDFGKKYYNLKKTAEGGGASGIYHSLYGKQHKESTKQHWSVVRKGRFTKEESSRSKIWILSLDNGDTEICISLRDYSLSNGYRRELIGKVSRLERNYTSNGSCKIVKAKCYDKNLYEIVNNEVILKNKDDN